MTSMRPPSFREAFSVSIFIVGLVTMIVAGAAVAISAVKWFLHPTYWDLLVKGVPWLFAGWMLGLVTFAAYLDMEEETDGS